jgi:hypothetical protein
MGPNPERNAAIFIMAIAPGHRADVTVCYASTARNIMLALWVLQLRQTTRVAPLARISTL